MPTIDYSVGNWVIWPYRAIGATNYMESPSLVVLTDQETFLWVHGGNCCYAPPYVDPNGTAGFYVAYWQSPFAPGILRHLRDLPLSNQGPTGDDHEIGDLTAVLIQGTWNFAYGRTTWSTWGSQNRLRTGFGEVSDLINGNAYFWDDMTAPEATGCAARASCQGIGALQFDALVRMPDGTYRLFGKDDVVPTGSSPDVRTLSYRFEPSTKLVDDRWHTLWDRNGVLKRPYVSDVAVGADGALYAVSSSDQDGPFLLLPGCRRLAVDPRDGRRHRLSCRTVLALHR